MNKNQIAMMALGDPEGWSFDDVSAWLDGIRMREYAGIFQESKIDGAMLLILEDEDLKDGLEIGNMMHRG